MIKAEEYLSGDELRALGFASVGRNVFVSRRALIAFPEKVRIGDSVRIDAFSTIIGGSSVSIGSFVHFGSSVTIVASASVSIGSFCGIASGARIFTSDDDYSGEYLTGPAVPSGCTNPLVDSILLEDHCVVGANSVVLPGSSLRSGAVVGALSLVQGELGEWSIYAGIPAKYLRARSKESLNKAQELRGS